MVNTRMMDIVDLHPDPNNARIHSVANISAIMQSLKLFGQRKPLVVQGSRIIAGNGTYQAAQALGWSEISVSDIPDDWDDSMAMAYAIADNRSAELAEWDEVLLEEQVKELESKDFDISSLFLEDHLDTALISLARPSLADRFSYPPMSILDQRTSEWRARRSEWLGLGISSEIGRESGATLSSLGGRVPDYYNQKNKVQSRLGRELSNEEFEAEYLIIKPYGNLSSGGTSVFDPFLCELIYRWFSALHAQILDPFAGGSVRGVVAAVLDRRYTGIELRGEQVKANNEQWPEIAKNYSTSEMIAPRWIIGDSREMDSILELDYRADLIFSCPPYADLEIYSDDAADLSSMEYQDFIKAYEKIIKTSLERLADDRFVVWVIGDVREKNAQGYYRGLVHETVRCFEAAGAHLYNEAILVQQIGSLAVRVGRFFSKSRKLGKTHQQVLIFVKGDPKKAAAYCGDVDVTMPQREDTDLAQ